MGNHSAESALYGSTTPFQKTAGLLSLICMVAALAMLVKWMQGSNTDEAFLGGLNWKEYIFNFHPIFMLTGMILSALTALLSYRLLPLPKPMTKSIHGLLHTFSLACIVIGLTCVIVGNNYPDYNTEGSYFANLTSLHSMIGVTTIGLYFQNYVLGVLHFLLPESIMPVEHRKQYMPIHVILGTISFVLAVAAVETGVMELTAELGCGWAPTSANTNPASTYYKLALGCKYANGVGVLVLFGAILGIIALADLGRFGINNVVSKADVQVGLLDGKY